MGRSKTLTLIAVCSWAIACTSTASESTPSPPVSANQPENAPDEGDKGAWVLYEDGHEEYIPAEQWARMQAEADAGHRRDNARYEQGCQAGDGDACSLLAWAYDDGKGVRPNRRRADAYRRKAAAAYEAACDLQGTDRELAACESWGRALLEGEGPAKDPDRGRALLVRAKSEYVQRCDAGSGEACHALGTLYILGEVVPRSWERQQELYARAFELRVQACERGAWDGCRAAASQLAVGDGIPKDPPRAQSLSQRAHELATTACNDGDPKACAYLEQITAP